MSSSTSSQVDASLLDGSHRMPAAGGYEPFGPHQKTKPKRDIKKLALIVGLSILAWGSTYTGMLELIQANLGEVGMVEKVATGLAVAMLQIMIVWLLDQMFSPIHASIKAFYIVGYLFLTLISVGFAFGFYWKVLESRSASTSSAESSIGSVQSALRGAETRLDQLVSTLEALTAISTQKADQESANGNSCPGSKPGAGPRMADRPFTTTVRVTASRRMATRSPTFTSRAGLASCPLTSTRPLPISWAASVRVL